jgi:hypothetical protein
LTNPKYGTGESVGGDGEYDDGLSKELVWYRSKDKSQFAAAGRALDCFNFRAGKEEDVFCFEPPYEYEQRITVDELRELYGIPQTETRKIELLIEKSTTK